MNNTTISGTLQKVLAQQGALAAFGAYAFRESHLGKILTEAARVCAEYVGAPLCKVCRYHHAGNDLLIVAGFGWKPDVIGRGVSRADESTPGGRAFVTRKPVVVSDLSKADFVLPAFYAEHGIVSTVNVLIMGSGEPFGVLEIDSSERREYDDADIQFLTGLANVLAEAVVTAERLRALQESLAEKEVMARELQHRVRNNLQVIYGMLVSEHEQRRSRRAKRGVADIARRVITLGQVYDHLLGEGMNRTIDFAAYLKSLCTELRQFQEAPRGRTQLIVQADIVRVDLDAATSLGIVVTELVSNRYRHAFAQGAGAITVSLRRLNEATGELIVRDDGAGFQPKGESKRHGLGLVKRLVDQVKGSIEVQSAAGTWWTIIFPIDVDNSVAHLGQEQAEHSAYQ